MLFVITFSMIYLSYSKLISTNSIMQAICYKVFFYFTFNMLKRQLFWPLKNKADSFYSNFQHDLLFILASLGSKNPTINNILIIQTNKLLHFCGKGSSKSEASRKKLTHPRMIIVVNHGLISCTTNQGRIKLAWHVPVVATNAKPVVGT